MLASNESPEVEGKRIQEECIQKMDTWICSVYIYTLFSPIIDSMTFGICFKRLVQDGCCWLS